MTLARLLAGFHFVFENKIILGVITLDLFAVLLGGATALLPGICEGHSRPRRAARGLGSPPGGPSGRFIHLRLNSRASASICRKAGRALLGPWAGFGIATIVFGLSRSFWLSFAMLFLCGATDNISVVVRHTLVYFSHRTRKRGRVSAVNSLFIGTSNELGGFESPVSSRISVGPVFSSRVSGGLGTI